MTIKELKELLKNLPPECDNYKVTTEEGYQGFDGEIFIHDKLKEVNID